MSVRFLSGVNIDSNTLFVDDANNLVGIGTASPTSELDVRGNNMGITGVAPTVLIYSNTTSGGKIAFVDQNWSSQIVGDGGRLRFNIGGTTEAMRIDNNGNVGIGITSPGTKLDVNGGSDVTVAKFYNLSATATQVEIGDSGNSQYSNLLLLSNSGQAEIWKSGTGYTSYGGALALNIYNSNGAIAFHPNNTQNAMFIATTGNVGIGTTSPVSKLTVIGTTTSAITVQSGSATSGLQIFNNSTTDEANIINYYNGPLILGTSNVERMRIAGNGNVGIGTTSPASLLNLSATTLPVLTLTRQDNGTTAAGAINFSATSNVRWQISTSQAIGNGLEFNTADGSGNVMYITRTGNVGIGTTSPAEKLHVAGNIRGAALQVYDGLGAGVTGVGAASSGGALRLYSNGAVGLTLNTTGAVQLNDYGAGANTGTVAYNLAVDSSGNIIETAGAVVDGSGTANYVSKWSDANTLTDSVIYDNGTNVGIGTTSPTIQAGFKQLSISAGVSGDVRGALNIQGARTADSTFASLAFYHKTNYVAGIESSRGGADNSGSLEFYTSNAGTLAERIRVTPAGYVGIGTTAPGAKLEVNGTIVAGTYNNTRAEITSNGNVQEFYGTEANPRWAISRDLVGGGQAGIGFNNTVGTINVTGSAIGGSLVRALGFYTSNGTSLVERMRIADGGNVGIGTTAPGAKLDVYRGLQTDTITRANAAAYIWGADIGLAIGQYSSGPYGTWLQSLKYDNNNSFPLSLNPSGGNVGIGTANPGTLLHLVQSSGPTIRLVRTSNRFDIAADNDFMELNARDASTYMIFKTADTERMRITSGGSLLIGSTTQGYNPQTQGYLLGVKSDTTQAFISIAKSGQTLDTEGMIVGLDSTTGYVWMRQNVDLTFGTNNTTKVTIAAGGNVGIGTTSPAYKLQVDGSTGVRNGSFYIGDESGSTNSAVEFYKSGTTIRMYTNTGAFGGTYGATSASLTLYSGSAYSTLINGNGDSYFNAGNLGIGTTSPREKIDVDGNIVTTWGNDRFVGLQFQQGSDYRNGLLLHGDNRATGILAKGGSGSNPYIWFGGGAGTTSEWARIDKDGNVGIGTNSPSYKLQVNGNAAFATNSGGLRIDSYDGDTAVIRPTVANGSILISDDSGTLDRGVEFLNGGGIVIKSLNTFDPLNVQSNGSSVLLAKSSGNVGIGTTAPDTRLHVKTSGDTDTGIRSDVGLDNNVASTPSAIFLNNIGGDTNDAVAATFGVGGTNRAKIISGRYSTGGYLQFQTGDTSNNLQDRVIITNNGHVGIGLTNPIGPLTVAATTSGDAIFLKGRSADNASRIDFYNNGQSARLYTIALGNSAVEHYADANIPMIFFTNGTERMRILAGGNVGIGTTAPPYALSVVRNANDWTGQYKNYGNNAYGLQIDLSGSTGATGGYVIGAYSQAGTGFFFKNDGNVGIGTTSPETKLHIAGGTDASIIRLENTSTGLSQGDTIGAIQFYNNDTTDDSPNVAASIYATAGPSGGSGHLSFRTKEAGTEGAAATATMTLTNGGNVGIGTTSPVGKLDVALLNTRRFIVTYDDSLVTIKGANDTGAGENLRIIGDNLIFNTSSAGSGSERMRITAAGNVGIGTTAPTAKLHIDSTDDNAYALRVQGNTNNSVGVWTGIGIAGESANTKTAILFEDIGVSYSRGKMHFALNNAADQTNATPSNAVMTLIPDGNVGIGTTSPAYKLSVVGESNFSENIYIGNGSSYGVWTDTAGVRRNGIYLNTSSGYLGIRSGTSSTGEQDRIVINQSTGNVGIGTTSPSYALSVVRNANDWIGQYKNYGSIAYGLQIDLSGSTGATGGYVIGAYSQTGTGFFLKNDGTVGIGTTSPATKLHVIGTESRFGGVASGYISVYNANSRSGYLQANEGSDFRIASDTNDMTFYVNGSERVRFTAGGNVGIGTTSPTEKLHVDGSALVTYNNSYQSTNSTGGKAILARVSPTSGIVNYAEYATVTNLNGFVIGSDDAQVKGVYASDKLEFITNTATRMAITSGGNVGIGTASPTNILHITGVMRMDNVSANDPALTNNATPKHGYGDVANEIYLAEPAAWFKINVEGTDYIIPAYLESV